MSGSLWIIFQENGLQFHFSVHLLPIPACDLQGDEGHFQPITGLHPQRENCGKTVGRYRLPTS